jgi:hypothetical protein
MSRRSLQRRLRGEGLPTPGQSVAYARFLEMYTLWSMGISSRARIASILDIADPASLGHLSQRLADRPLGHFLDPLSGEDPFDWFVRKIGG